MQFHISIDRDEVPKMAAVYMINAVNYWSGRFKWDEEMLDNAITAARKLGFDPEAFIMKQFDVPPDEKFLERRIWACCYRYISHRFWLKLGVILPDELKLIVIEDSEETDDSKTDRT